MGKDGANMTEHSLVFIEAWVKEQRLKRQLQALGI
tara:strand:+ start:6050 stop:6154 length:105 start_codon:yes stop_codon:yes gene_type:complete